MAVAFVGTRTQLIAAALLYLFLDESELYQQSTTTNDSICGSDHFTSHHNSQARMPPGRQTCKTRPLSIYDNEERRIINAHKDEYRKQTSTDERSRIFKHKVVVDIFNHWHSIERVPQGEEAAAAAIQVCNEISTGRKASSNSY